MELYPKGFRNLPEGQDSGISLAQLQPADIGAINSHALGKG
jgi:hypothetical protein